MTKNLLRYALLMLGFAILLCASAPAALGGPRPPKQPEIDPSLAISGITLLVGSLAVLRGRRKK